MSGEEEHPNLASSDTEAYFSRVLEAAGEWARYSDPKALAVLVFLGLGLTDLVGNATELRRAHELGGLWGHASTDAFWAGLLLAIVTVVFVSGAVFPRLGRDLFARKAQGKSLFYFRGVAEFEDAGAYEDAVRKRTSDQLVSEVAHQAYEVAKVASRKHEWTQRAYVAVILFLASWAVSRLALSLAT